MSAAAGKASPTAAWLRALELTAPIAKQPLHTLPAVVAEQAARLGDAPALLSDRECLSYRGLARRVNQYARWALAVGLRKGDAVGLLMPNRPEYMAVWLGLSSMGVVVALLNTNLRGASLAHSIGAAAPKHIVADATCLAGLHTALLLLGQPLSIHVVPSDTGVLGHSDFPVLDVGCCSGEPLGCAAPPTSISDLALYIYTSGTTGLPKAAKVSHARLMQWSCWFAGMMQALPSDRMYNCLPMYHSVGGVQAPGALLVAGGSVVIRDRFSAGAFWSDVCRWDCTLFQYIGELCRYLLHSPLSAWEQEHRLRLACGNGLAAEVWTPFQERFAVPQILEFYASTEGNVSLFNVEGKVGAVGHIPSYLQHRFSPPLVLHDAETGEPARGRDGFCIRCGVNEAGEALGRITDEPGGIGTRFDGYTSGRASEAKILRDVFAPGDAWFRTGDLLRRDEKGFFYFLDRVGDTFRRKGENVATPEVAAALCAFPGVRHANVYGVAVAGAEGRVGMAALVADRPLDFVELHEHLAGTLPDYARPCFLRVCREAELTGTWKYSKRELVREGFDPAAVADPLYFALPPARGFVPLDAELYRQIQSGKVRL